MKITCGKCGRRDVQQVGSDWAGMGWLVAVIVVFLFPVGLAALLVLPFLPGRPLCAMCT